MLIPTSPITFPSHFILYTPSSDFLTSPLLSPLQGGAKESAR